MREREKVFHVFESEIECVTANLVCLFAWEVLWLVLNRQNSAISKEGITRSPLSVLLTGTVKKPARWRTRGIQVHR